jgi:molybdopterin/thiamine biosynthesis adenylyltransferase
MNHDLDRYARQTIFPGIGEAGQRRMLASRVVVLGCGATGSVIANTLARAGVGSLRLVDRDFVERNNLQRQVLYEEADAESRLPKAVAAREALARVNREISLEGIVADVHAGNVETLIAGADLVMDGTDNFATRYVLNDACVKQGVAWVYTGAVSSYGMSFFIQPGRTACLRCIFPEPPAAGTAATCDTAGVLAPVVSVAASLSCTEAIKYLAGARDALHGSMVYVDVWELSFHALSVARRTADGPLPADPPCPCCVERQFPFLTPAESALTTLLCGRNAVQITPARPQTLDLPRVAERLAAAGPVTVNPYLLRLTVDGHEITLFGDARAIIEGTTDETAARALYAKYVGT